MRCLLAILALAASLTRGEEPSITLPPDLARVLVDYETAWRVKDAAALARLFAEDGFVLSPGNPMARGRRAIEKAYRDAGGPLFLHAVAYAAEGNIGTSSADTPTARGLRIPASSHSRFARMVPDAG